MVVTLHDDHITSVVVIRSFVLGLATSEPHIGTAKSSTECPPPAHQDDNAQKNLTLKTEIFRYEISQAGNALFFQYSWPLASSRSCLLRWRIGHRDALLPPEHGTTQKLLVRKLRAHSIAQNVFLRA